jgi:ABC-type proline/glycine betaine transport system permease subunit
VAGETENPTVTRYTHHDIRKVIKSCTTLENTGCEKQGLHTVNVSVILDRLNKDVRRQAD